MIYSAFQLSSLPVPDPTFPRSPTLATTKSSKNPFLGGFLYLLNLSGVLRSTLAQLIVLASFEGTCTRDSTGIRLIMQNEIFAQRSREA